nr:hypothetical protein [Tanacetum cinerariifolium]
MEIKDSLSSFSNLEEQEIQQLQKQAKTSKENSLNKLNALQSTIQHLSSSNYSMYNKFRDAFQRLFEADKKTFKSVLSRNMQNLERQLYKETLHEKDLNSDLLVIKLQFEQFIHSKVLEPSNYNSYDLETRRDFKEYTQMKAQTFKETIIQNINSIEQFQALNASSGDKDCSRIVSNKGNDQGLENQSNTYGDESNRPRNEYNEKSTSSDDTDIRPSYDTEPMVEVPYTAKYNVFVVDTQHYEQPECINNTHVVEIGDCNVIPDSSDMCNNDIQNDQNVVECDDERVTLANLIANLKLDVDENKKIQKQLKKSNTTLAQELKECKSILAETSRTMRESNSIRDSCLVALQSKNIEFEKYKACNDRTADYDKLKRKLNETLGLLAQKDIDIKEGLKLKAYEISVVKEKHDELVKMILLTKSHYEESLKKEIHDLEYDKAEFSNMYDTILQECVSNDVMCADLHSLSGLDAHTELQCLYLHKIVQLILFIVDSGCMKHMTGNLKLLCNFVEKYLGTVHFGNDQFAPILGYGDLVQGNITINKGNDLLIDNRGSDLYTIYLQETISLTTLCLIAKASKTQAWLWHQGLSHLNFDYINLLSKKDVVIGLPKLKYIKDQLCSSCEVSKAKRSSFKTKTVLSSKGRLNFLHMDLCGPMRVASINGKKYILVIIHEYSIYTWTLFLCSKDETPEVRFSHDDPNKSSSPG